MADTTLEFLLTATDRASRVFNDVGREVDTTAGKMDGMKVAAGLAMAAAGVAVAKFAADSVSAYADSQTAQSELSFAFEQFPNLADTNVAALQSLNSELAKKTGFDDDAAAAAQANLAQYGLTGSQIAELTPLLEDYAAKTGTDLPGAAEVLGKAMLGQGRALKGVGIDFQDAGSVGANFDQVVSGLTDKVGGFAVQESDTAAGQTRILKDQMEELQESVGERLMPAVSSLTDKGIAMMDWISQNGPLAAGLAVTFGVLGTAIAVAANWTAISTTASTIATAAQWLWNAAMSANPIGLVILAIAALVAAIVWVVTHFDTVKAAGAAAWEWIKNAWSGAGEFFSGIGDGIEGVFKGAFNKVAGWWNDSVGSIGFTIPDWVPLGGGNRFDVPDIPYLATGGTLLRGGLAVVGEQGPEIVSLPTGATVHPNGTGPGGMTFNIYEAVSAQATAMQIARRTNMLGA